MASVKITKAPRKPAHEIKTFTVTFELNNDQSPIIKNCLEGEAVEFPPNPAAPEGTFFRGWGLVDDYMADVLPGTSYTPHRSLTLYALYGVEETLVVYWKMDSNVNTLHLSTKYADGYNSWPVSNDIPPWTSAYGQPQVTDPSGVMIDTPMAPRYCSYWFCNMPHLATLTKFYNLKMHNCESIAHMFHYCAILPGIDWIVLWKTPNLKDMSYAFARCKRMDIITIIFSDLSKVETVENLCLADAELVRFGAEKEMPSLKIASGMFNNCPKLDYVDLSGCQATNVTSMSSMFRDCPSLRFIKLTNWNTYKVANMNSMFSGDTALQHVYVDEGWTTDAVTTSADMFKNCSSLPNFDAAVVDKTHAKIGEYLEKGD